MTPDGFLRLAWQTVVDPRGVATMLMSLRFPREALWMALVLMALLNVLLFSIGNMAAPPDAPVPPAMASPFIFATFLIGGIVITVFALFWVGRAAGGTGGLEDMLILMTWLQALRVLVQGVASILTVISPALASLLVLVAGAAGFWITLNFVAAAHRFPSLLKSLAVLVTAIVGMALGLAFMLSLIGVTTYGMS